MFYASWLHKWLPDFQKCLTNAEEKFKTLILQIMKINSMNKGLVAYTTV